MANEPNNRLLRWFTLVLMVGGFPCCNQTTEHDPETVADSRVGRIEIELLNFKNAEGRYPSSEEFSAVVATASVTPELRLQEADFAYFLCSVKDREFPVLVDTAYSTKRGCLLVALHPNGRFVAHLETRQAKDLKTFDPK